MMTVCAALLHLLTLTLFVCTALTEAAEDVTCDNINDDISPGKVVAVGARKQIAEAFSAIHGPVLIAEPWNGTWYRAHHKDKQRDAAYLAYIVGENGMRRVLLHEYHPQMFGVNATYDIKLVSHNQQRLVYYSSKTPYDSDFSCDSDRDCSVHFVDAKQIGAGLLLPEAPLDFSCNKQLHRCRGLDSRLNMYAIGHVLWKPLFGLGGHPLAGGVVSDFFRPKIQQIVDAAAALDPADRPPVEDLRNALQSLIRGQVAPYFVPQNTDVQLFSSQRDKADKMLHGATLKDAPRWDLPDDIALPKLTHGDKPITLTNWFFKFQPTPQMPMTVRLLGVYNEQPWGSSPIYVRENNTVLRTRSGKAYVLRGAVNCEGLKTEGFSDEFCHKFHHGFPSRWKENLSDAWDKLQNALRKQFFAKNAPKSPLQYDAADWIDPSELSVSRPGSASEDFVVPVSSEQSTESAFSIRTKAKSGGVAHAVWLSASASTETASASGTAADDEDDEDDEIELGSTYEIVSEKPGDAAAAKQLLKEELEEKQRLEALASKSPCGAEGREAEGVCCLTTCGTCGGPHCETHTGGRAGCCPDQIHRSGLLCRNNLPPCILQPIAQSKASSLPQRVSAPHDDCSWAPSEPKDAPYDIDESNALLAASSIGAKRCTVPQETAQVGIVPHTVVSAAHELPNAGKITVDIAVTVLSAPLELVIGISNGTSSSFQQQFAVLRFNGETKTLDIAKNPSKTPLDKALHTVDQGKTFNIRLVIDAEHHTYNVSVRDFVSGAPPMALYAARVPYTSIPPVTAFKPSVAVGSIADNAACANRLGFTTLLRSGNAMVCFGHVVTLAPAAATAAALRPMTFAPKAAPAATTIVPKVAPAATTVAPKAAPAVTPKVTPIATPAATTAAAAKAAIPGASRV